MVAALVPPDYFDFALMRIRFSLKRSLTDRFVFDGLFSASGLGVYRSSAAQPVLGPVLLQTCASLFYRSTGARSDAVAVLVLTCLGPDGQPSVLFGQLLCPTVVCCVRVPDDLDLVLTP